ncbi:MAG: hypothetical protein JOS17DRAFT_486322 [Linnemannia elongata]|nr:MAG: hypothetical protein JOS17DRAFT_486322 [Linnemannia elongata]
MSRISGLLRIPYYSFRTTLIYYCTPYDRLGDTHYYCMPYPPWQLCLFSYSTSTNTRTQVAPSPDANANQAMSISPIQHPTLIIVRLRSRIIIISLSHLCPSALSLLPPPISTRACLDKLGSLHIFLVTSTSDLVSLVLIASFLLLL